jgi:hypothetical protein
MMLTLADECVSFLVCFFSNSFREHWKKTEVDLWFNFFLSAVMHVLRVIVLRNFLRVSWNSQWCCLVHELRKIALPSTCTVLRKMWNWGHDLNLQIAQFMKYVNAAGVDTPNVLLKKKVIKDCATTQISCCNIYTNSNVECKITLESTKHVEWSWFSSTLILLYLTTALPLPYQTACYHTKNRCWVMYYCSIMT